MLELIADGKSDFDIAIILNLSPKSVNYRVEKIKQKFAVATRIQAVVSALRQGFIH